MISETEGYLNHLPAHQVGIISRDLGAGRVTMDDELDMAAGIYLHKKRGDYVKKATSSPHSTAGKIAPWKSWLVASWRSYLFPKNRFPRHL